MRNLKLTLIAALAAFLSHAAIAANPDVPQSLSLPTVVGSNMVLQQNATANIWGFAKPKSKITVKADWADAVTVKADENGDWIASLKTLPASFDPHTITITCAKESITLENIVFGEVWLCSGQSNMEFRVKNAIDLKKELKNAPNDALRLYDTGRISNETEQKNVENAKWSICSAESLPMFSAVAYAFGKELQEALNVPVGLINASYGGTFIEGWLKNSVLSADPKIVSDANAIKHKSWAGKPSHLYNANIYPIRHETIAGTIWYQGCANVASRPRSYDHSLEVLINSWREEFRNPDMPFYLVQLVPHTYAGIKGAQLRECQAKTAARMEHVEYVVANDQQDIPGDIHPRYKAVIGHRLAMCALGEHYGKEAIFRAPEFKSMKVEGDAIRVTLDNVPSSIMLKGSGRINGFQVAEKDPENDRRLIFHLAEAQIEPDNTILVKSDKVSNPQAVRYCFNEDIGNVFSAEGLPLAPFRSDKNNGSMSARPFVEAPSEIAITVTGKGYTRSTFTQGAHMWPNLKQTLSDEYPKEYEGFEMLTAISKKGESTPGGKITAHADGRVYIIIRDIKAFIKAATKKGWTIQLPTQLRAVMPDGKKIANQYIAYKNVKEGDEVDVPVVKDHYSIFILAKKIEYTAAEE